MQLKIFQLHLSKRYDLILKVIFFVSLKRLSFISPTKYFLILMAVMVGSDVALINLSLCHIHFTAEYLLYHEIFFLMSKKRIYHGIMIS